MNTSQIESFHYALRNYFKNSPSLLYDNDKTFVYLCENIHIH